MNVSFLDILAIILYFCVVAVFAFYTRRTKTFAEFSVAKHSVPAGMIFASLCATYVGPGFAVGFTSRGYSSGFVFYILAFTFIIQTILVGYFFAPRLSRFRTSHTLGDVIDCCYGKFSHLLTGIVSVGLCIGFAAIMAKVGGILLQSMTGLPLMVCISLVTFVTAIYAFSGGIRASIATDGLQFSLFSIIIPLMLVFAFFKSPVSLSEVTSKALDLTRTGFSSMTTIQIIAVLLSFLLGETLIPPYANRALAAKNSNSSKKGFMGAGLFGIIWLAIVASLGIFGHQFVPNGTPPDDVFITMANAILGPGLFGFLLAALIAIVMSSQDSVMNAGAVAMVRDIFGIRKEIEKKKSLRYARYSTLFIAFIATILARYSPSIIDGLLIIYSIWAPTMIIPLFLGLIRKKTVHAAGWLSMLAGGTTSIIWQTLLKEPGGIPAILVGIAAACIGYILGHFLGNSESNLALEG